jgi:hypothetical protein
MYAPENSSYRILIADDEPHIRQILRFTLERAGYQVFTASDGEEALARARNQTQSRAARRDDAEGRWLRSLSQNATGLRAQPGAGDHAFGARRSARSRGRDSRTAPTTISSSRTPTKSCSCA